MSQHLDKERRADLARDPDYTPTLPQVQAWDFFKQARDQYRARQEGTAGDPIDPPTTVDLTSMQKLGDADVLVCYEESADGITVTGVDLRNGFAEAEWFAADTVAYWAESIGAELKKERAL